MCRNKHTRKFINARTSIMDPRGVYVLKIADHATKSSPNNKNGIIRCNSKRYIHETGCIENLEPDSGHPLYVWRGEHTVCLSSPIIFQSCMRWWCVWKDKGEGASSVLHLPINPFEFSTVFSLSHSLHLLSHNILFLTIQINQGQKLHPTPVPLQSSSLTNSWVCLPPPHTLSAFRWVRNRIDS